MVLGLGYDEDGLPVVVYCDNHEPPRGPFYTRKLGTFLQTMDNHEPRFKKTHQQRHAPDPVVMLETLRDIALGFVVAPETVDDSFDRFLWAQRQACKAVGMRPPPDNSKVAGLDAGVPTDAPVSPIDALDKHSNGGQR